MSASGDVVLPREETLAALPRLLGLAREAVAAAFAPGDPEIDALRALLEECVVGAHRLCLREQIRGADDTDTGDIGKAEP